MTTNIITNIESLRGAENPLFASFYCFFERNLSPLLQDSSLQDSLLQGSLLQDSLLQDSLLGDSLPQDSFFSKPSSFLFFLFLFYFIKKTKCFL